VPTFTDVGMLLTLSDRLNRFLFHPNKTDNISYQKKASSPGVTVNDDYIRRSAAAADFERTATSSRIALLDERLL